MERRPRHEDRREQLRGELSVYGDARLAVVLQACRPLEDHERAMFCLADQERGAHELVDDALELLLAARREEPVQRTELTDLPECAPELRLEDDHERDEGDG